MNEVQEALKERHSYVHPLIFQRSMERASSDGELFDILETIPEFPLLWNNEEKRWEHTDDLIQIERK